MRYYTHIAAAILLYIVIAYFVNLNSILLGIFFAAWISVFPDLIDKVTGKHRGYGHTLFWLIPFALIGYFNIEIAAALVIGFNSHLLMDCLTVNGCPLLHPLLKDRYTCFNKIKRFKTGTNGDKAVFIFLLFLLVPSVLFLTGTVDMGKIAQGQNFVFGAGTSTADTSTNNTTAVDTMKNTFNINLQINQNVDKNITVEKVSENKTTISIS